MRPLDLVELAGDIVGLLLSLEGFLMHYVAVERWILTDMFLEASFAEYLVDSIYLRN